MTQQATTPKKTRVVRTPAEKAIDRLEGARARVQRADKACTVADARLAEAQAARNAAHNERADAEAAFTYENQHPDLPQAKRGPSTEPATS